MFDALDDTRPLPFAPGASPFHVKGTVYQGHLEWVARNCPGGIDGMNRAFRDPRLAPFLSQRFLAATRYDLLPAITSAYVVARLARLGFAEFLRLRSRIQAERDLGGIYRLLLKLSSPDTVVSRYAAVLAQYFDFVSATATLVSPGTIVIEQSKIPAMIFNWLGPVIETYIEVLIGRAGGASVKVATDPPAADGDVQGVAAVRMLSRATWA
jgi:hypothetical protein